MSTTISPELAGCQRAAVYFDRTQARTTRTPGRWMTTIITAGGTGVTRTVHPTEAQARAYIGLEGGSESPYYVPEGRAGSEVARGE
jgi:hypothetical protein